MSDDTTVPEAGTDTTETAAPAVDLSPINEQFERLDSRFSAIEQALGQQQPQPEPEDPYAGITEYADRLGFNVPSEEQQDDTEALRALAELADMRAQRGIEQHVNPEIQALRNELQAIRARDDLRDLQSQYPKLATPEVEQAVTAKLQDIQQELPPGVPVTKSLVALAYRAWEADQMATDEGSARQPNNELEHPGGAGPEGSELTWSQQILRNSGAGDKGASYWGFNAL